MRIWSVPTLFLCAATLAGCGPQSPVYTPGFTAPVYSGPGSSAPAQSSTAEPSSRPTARPTPTFNAVSFPTLEAAHDYAAQASAQFFKAVRVTDQAKCPTAEGSPCYIESNQRVDGTNATYFIDAIGFNPTGAADIVYLYNDGGGWHWMDSLGTQAEYPAKGSTEIIQVDSGCANIHTSATAQSGVVACLKSDEQVTIDSDPSYADGHIWWHLSDRHGWVAHDNLIAKFVQQAQT